MQHVKVSKIVDAKPNDVWSVLNRFDETYIYHPFVETSKSLNGISSGVGAKRECVMYGGQRLEETVTEHDAQNSTYLVEVLEFGPLPVTAMKVRITLAEAGADRTNVTYDCWFSPRFGIVGRLVLPTILKPQLRKMLNALIDGVGAHIRTGRLVENGGQLGEQIA